jgi:hypothetical protein
MPIGASKSTYAPKAAGMLADADRTYNYLQNLRTAAKNAKQGNLEVIFGTVKYQLDAASQIPANTRRKAYQDGLGEAAAGGLILTYADSNLWFGRCPSGQILILQGMGLSIWRGDAAITDQEIELIARNIYIVMQLRNNPVNMGCCAIWPTTQGSRGTGNGNVDVGVRPFDPGVVLLPTEDFSIDFIAARNIQLNGDEGSPYYIQVHNPGLRVYDERVLARI